MAKQLSFNTEACHSLKRGIDPVAEAVKTTFGPHDGNVAIAMQYGAPIVTHDGVTVANGITLKEPFSRTSPQ